MVEGIIIGVLIGIVATTGLWAYQIRRHADKVAAIQTKVENTKV